MNEFLERVLGHRRVLALIDKVLHGLAVVAQKRIELVGAYGYEQPTRGSIEPQPMATGPRDRQRFPAMRAVAIVGYCLDMLGRAP